MCEFDKPDKTHASDLYLIFENSLIIYEVKTDTLAVFDTFLPGFYGSHKVNLQNVYVSELSFLKPYTKLAVRVLSGIKHSAIASCLYT